MQTKTYYTKKELAEILRISSRNIHKLPIKSQKVGRIVRWCEATILKTLPKLYIGAPFVQINQFSCNWLTAEEAGKRVRVSKATVLRWARDRKLKHFRFGEHTLRFRVEDVDAVFGVREGVKQKESHTCRKLRQ